MNAAPPPAAGLRAVGLLAVGLLSVGLLEGCVWISDADHADRIDQDGDGGAAWGYPGGIDCDDADPAVMDPTIWYADADGDGFGDPARATSACEAPEGHVEDASDCDDADPSAFPGAVEVCSDGRDNDCDGQTCLPAGEYTLPVGARVRAFDLRVSRELTLGAGDLDGDGAADLGVGVPGVADIGKVYLFPTPVAGDLTAEDTPVVITGPSGTARAGHALAWFDPDGDGQASLVIGAPGVDHTNSYTGYDVVDGGAVFILDGPLPAEVDLAVDGQRVMGDLLSRSLIEISQSEFGARFAPAPDLDGDGLGELMIAAPGFWYDASGREPGAGRWLMLPGDREAEITGYDMSPTHDQSWAIAGNQVHSVGRGDLVFADFEGVGELKAAMYAWPHYNGEPDVVGRERVTFFDPPGAEQTVVQLTDHWDYIEASEDYRQRFGERLIADDFDGDGAVDLLVGAAGELSSLGAVYLFYGDPREHTSPLEADLALRGDAEGDAFGDAVSWGSDLDGDGRLELVVGAPGAMGGEGAVYVFAELGTGALDGGDAAWTFLPGGRWAEYIGGHLDAAADLDGDGHHDISLLAVDEDEQEVSLMIVAGGAL